MTVNGSCIQCNNGLNKAFEEQLTRRLAHFRRIVRTSDRREELPTIDVRVEANGKELTAKLMSDGTTQLKPVFTRIVKGDAEDAVQEALLAACKHINQFNRQSQISTWFTTIVRNCALMQLRKRQRQIYISLDKEFGEEQPRFLWEGLAYERPSPEEEFHNFELTLRASLLRSANTT